MSQLSEFLAKLSPSQSKNQAQTITRGGLASIAKIAIHALSEGRYIAIVVKNREEAISLKAFMTLFTPELSVGPIQGSGAKADKFMPLYYETSFLSLSPFNKRSLTREGWAERLSVLYALGRGVCRGVILTADNLIPRLPSKNFFDSQELFLRLHEDMAPEILMDQLVDWGYQRESMVSRAGDIARRGDILDVFPAGYDKPVRFDFFGDTVDEMRFFDPNTQRSVGKTEEICLLPVSCIRQDEDSRKQINHRLASLFRQGNMTEFRQAALSRAVEQGDNRVLPGNIYDDSTGLEDWLPKDTIWILPGKDDFEDYLSEAAHAWYDSIEDDRKDSGFDQSKFLSLREPKDVQSLLAEFPRVYCEPLRMGIEATGTDFTERNYYSFAELFIGQEDWDRPWQQMVAALRNWMKEKKQVILAFASDRGRQKFLKLAEQDGLIPSLRYDTKSKGLFALVAPIHNGAELVWDNSLILGEDLLQPSAAQGKRVASGAFKGLDSYDELTNGDLLVHRDYGVGRFDGLHRMQLGGVDNDYLLLEYANNAKLYIPVDRLSVVQRFKTGEGNVPLLDRLGSQAWTNSKAKVRKAIEKIAADLVEMYAWRKVAKGFSYSPLGEMYREFEASFGFEETPDQARAIQEVLADMEKPEPMDRLVCGDVGFGKTEVALRASFRAACDGRQVALLCPTTILAEQHYQTFRSRLSGFPINVGLLSRFVTKRKQIEVLNAASKGQIDILIGTHRLLSKDVILPNLGLLILDEEQRFGVRHKERLKQMKKNVDALTLTATPIPRTLQLSMSGIRELSVIETAPPERKPVATALIEKDRAVLKQVLERELERKGQVFWVYNRVNGLEKVVSYVKELAPTARVGMAHGQMPERELENTMHKFWHGELDVLVCTSIIESGLDFPQANTLIVDQAQLFGLGQLYQLRGRVGRSDRQAYAIFVVNDMNHMTKIARERMRIILELDYLGAGFQVAMEDLRLRGAGNILGEVQSGHMARVGLDMYLEMLEEAVNKIKNGDDFNAETETEINLGLPAFIPEKYVEDGKERLKYYKMLSCAFDDAGRHDVEMEMKDKFGSIPTELATFMEVLDLKQSFKSMGVLKADISLDRIKVTFMQGQKKVQAEKLVQFIKEYGENAKLYPPASLELRLKSFIAQEDTHAQILRKAKNILMQLVT